MACCINNFSLPHLKEHEGFFENKKINEIFIRKLILEKKNNKEFFGDYFLFEGVVIQCQIIQGCEKKVNPFEISRGIPAFPYFSFEHLIIKMSTKDYVNIYEKLNSKRNFSVETFSNTGFLLKKFNIIGQLISAEIGSEIYLTFQVDFYNLVIV